MLNIGIIKKINANDEIINTLTAKFMPEEKNIIQIIKDAENTATRNIENARAEAENRIRETKTKITRDKEVILKNFKEKMADMHNKLKPQAENIKKEIEKSFKEEISALEIKFKENANKATDFILKKLIE